MALSFVVKERYKTSMSKSRFRTPEAMAYKSWYNKSPWKIARLTHLKKHPFCKHCLELGRTVPATVVNHIVPHKGNMELFLDAKNFESACKLCHDGAIQSYEKTGVFRGVSLDGFPLDKSHHWR